jgi:hypothetical protein
MKECQCAYEYPCEEVLSVEKETVFEFDAATFDASVSEHPSIAAALKAAGIGGSQGLVYSLGGNSEGVSASGPFLEVDMSRGEGCMTTYFEIDSLDAATAKAGSFEDVSFELYMNVVDDGWKDAEDIGKYRLSTTPCSPDCGIMQAQTNFFVKDDASSHQIHHAFRAVSEKTVVNFSPTYLAHTTPRSAHIQSIIVNKITKRFAATSTMSEQLQRVIKPRTKTCEELKPQCVPFSVDSYPLCEGVIQEGEMVYSHKLSPDPRTGGITMYGQDYPKTALGTLSGVLPFMSEKCIPEMRRFYCLAQIKLCEEVTSKTGEVVAYPRAVCNEMCHTFHSSCENDFEEFNKRMPFYYKQDFPYKCDTETVAETAHMTTPNAPTTGGELFVPELHGTQKYPQGWTTLATSQDIFQVPCTLARNGSFVEIPLASFRCPDGLAPRDDGQLGDYCLLPCPSLVFDDAEYSAMLSASVVLGLFAMLGNAFMVITHGLLPRKAKNHQFALLNAAAVLGFMWCLVEVVPSLIWGNAVACACDTELCYHNNLVCSISEVSTFVQQSLFIALTCYMVDSYLVIMLDYSLNRREKLYPVYGLSGVVIPMLNLALTLALSSFEKDDPNYHLNALRSAFSCHPQLSTMWKEVLLLYASTMVCCVLIFGIVFRLASHIYSHTVKAARAKAATTNDASAKTASAKAASATMSVKIDAVKKLKRLILLGSVVLCLFAMYVSATVYFAQIMSDFGEASEAWKKCGEYVSMFFGECADVLPNEFTNCLNLNHAIRTNNQYDGGCGHRPDNAPSLIMMVLCTAAPSGVALAAPLVFGTGEKYVGLWRKKLRSTSVRPSSVKVKQTQPIGGYSNTSSVH